MQGALLGGACRPQFVPMVKTSRARVVVDRLVQQMILQVPGPIFDPTFMVSLSGTRFTRRQI